MSPGRSLPTPGRSSASSLMAPEACHWSQIVKSRDAFKALAPARRRNVQAYWFRVPTYTLRARPAIRRSCSLPASPKTERYASATSGNCLRRRLMSAAAILWGVR